MNFKQLMERAKAGDSAAVTELLMMYRPLLLKEAILDSNTNGLTTKASALHAHAPGRG